MLEKHSNSTRTLVRVCCVYFLGWFFLLIELDRVSVHRVDVGSRDLTVQLPGLDKHTHTHCEYRHAPR